MQGHYALIPLQRMHGDVKVRGRDPLPCSHFKSRQHALESLSWLVKTLKVHDCFSKRMLSKALPLIDWHNPPTLRQHVQNVAQELSIVARISNAGKSATMLFGFCRQCEWDAPTPFARRRLYLPGAQHLLRHHEYFAPHHCKEWLAYKLFLNTPPTIRMGKSQISPQGMHSIEVDCGRR